MRILHGLTLIVGSMRRMGGVFLLAALGAFVPWRTVGRRRAARHEPGGLNLGLAWAGNAILCPNQHEFADVDRRD
jgi:hypothetical protein